MRSVCLPCKSLLFLLIYCFHGFIYFYFVLFSQVSWDHHPSDKSLRVCLMQREGDTCDAEFGAETKQMACFNCRRFYNIK